MGIEVLGGGEIILILGSYGRNWIFWLSDVLCGPRTEIGLGMPNVYEPPKYQFTVSATL